MEHNRLDDSERSRIKSVVHELLTRHLQLQRRQLPVTAEELYPVYLHALEQWRPAAREFAEATTRLWKFIDPERDDDDKPFDTPEMAGFTVRTGQGHRVMLQLEVLDFDDKQLAICHRPEYIPGDLYIGDLPLPYEKRLAFDEWLGTTVEVVNRVSNSVTALDNAIENANTVGQLHRICPELVRYCYGSTKQAFDAQKRRSPMPRCWSPGDRRAMFRLAEHMALCALAPRVEHQHKTPQAFAMTNTLAFERQTIQHYGAYAVYREAEVKDLSALVDGEWKPPGWKSSTC